MGKLTKAQRDLLAFIATGRDATPQEIAAAMGKPVSAISAARNSLLRLGYVEPWARWNDMPQVSAQGRAALAQESKE